jgi:tetratricopeptide (TPR) repeat protein
MIRMLCALVLGACVATASAQTAPAPLPPELEPIRTAFRAGDFEKASDLAEALVEAQPDHARGWQWLARAYAQRAMRAGLLGKASLAGKCREAYEKSVALDPAHVETQFELHQFYVQAPGLVGGGEDKSRAQAATIAKLDASYGHLAAGMVAEKFDEDEAAAEREYRAAVDAGGPNVGRARQSLANWLAAKERWDDARAIWAAVLETNPDDGVALFMTGRLAALSGQSLEAGLAALDRYLALETKPEDIGVAPAHWRRGLVLEKLGRMEEAVASLTAAVAADAKFEQAKTDLARLK